MTFCPLRAAASRRESGVQVFFRAEAKPWTGRALPGRSGQMRGPRKIGDFVGSGKRGCGAWVACRCPPRRFSSWMNKRVYRFHAAISAVRLPMIQEAPPIIRWAELFAIAIEPRSGMFDGYDAWFRGPTKECQGQEAGPSGASAADGGSVRRKSRSRTAQKAVTWPSSGARASSRLVWTQPVPLPDAKGWTRSRCVSPC